MAVSSETIEIRLSGLNRLNQLEATLISLNSLANSVADGIAGINSELEQNRGSVRRLAQIERLSRSTIENNTRYTDPATRRATGTPLSASERRRRQRQSDEARADRSQSIATMRTIGARTTQLRGERRRLEIAKNQYAQEYLNAFQERGNLISQLDDVRERSFRELRSTRFRTRVRATRSLISARQDDARRLGRSPFIRGQDLTSRDQAITRDASINNQQITRLEENARLSRLSALTRIRPLQRQRRTARRDGNTELVRSLTESIDGLYSGLNDELRQSQATRYALTVDLGRLNQRRRSLSAIGRGRSSVSRTGQSIRQRARALQEIYGVTNSELTIDMGEINPETGRRVRTPIRRATQIASAEANTRNNISGARDINTLAAKRITFLERELGINNKIQSAEQRRLLTIQRLTDKLADLQTAGASGERFQTFEQLVRRLQGMANSRNMPAFDRLVAEANAAASRVAIPKGFKRGPSSPIRGETFIAGSEKNIAARDIGALTIEELQQKLEAARRQGQPSPAFQRAESLVSRLQPLADANNFRQLDAIVKQARRAIGIVVRQNKSIADATTARTKDEKEIEKLTKKVLSGKRLETAEVDRLRILRPSASSLPALPPAAPNSPLFGPGKPAAPGSPAYGIGVPTGVRPGLRGSQTMVNGVPQPRIIEILGGRRTGEEARAALKGAEVEAKAAKTKAEEIAKTDAQVIKTLNRKTSEQVSAGRSLEEQRKKALLSLENQNNLLRTYNEKIADLEKIGAGGRSLQVAKNATSRMAEFINSGNEFGFSLASKRAGNEISAMQRSVRRKRADETQTAKEKKSVKQVTDAYQDYLVAYEKAESAINRAQNAGSRFDNSDLDQLVNGYRQIEESATNILKLGKAELSDFDKQLKLEKERATRIEKIASSTASGLKIEQQLIGLQQEGVDVSGQLLTLREALNKSIANGGKLGIRDQAALENQVKRSRELFGIESARLANAKKAGRTNETALDTELDRRLKIEEAQQKLSALEQRLPESAQAKRARSLFDKLSQVGVSDGQFRRIDKELRQVLRMAGLGGSSKAATRVERITNAPSSPSDGPLQLRKLQLDAENQITALNKLEANGIDVASRKNALQKELNRTKESGYLISQQQLKVLEDEVSVSSKFARNERAKLAGAPKASSGKALDPQAAQRLLARDLFTGQSIVGKLENLERKRVAGFGVADPRTVEVTQQIVRLETQLNAAKQTGFELTRENLDALTATVNKSRQLLELDTQQSKLVSETAKIRRLQAERRLPQLQRDTLTSALGDLSRADAAAKVFRGGRSGEQALSNIIGAFNSAINGGATGAGADSPTASAGAAGQNVVDTFASKLTIGASKAATAGMKFASAGVDGIKKALGIKSPSRVVIEIVRNIVNTYISKLNEAAPQIKAAFTSAFSSAKSAARDAVKTGREAAAFGLLNAPSRNPQAGITGQFDFGIRRPSPGIDYGTLTKAIANLTIDPAKYGRRIEAVGLQNFPTELLREASARGTLQDMLPSAKLERISRNLPGLLEKQIDNAFVKSANKYSSTRFTLASMSPIAGQAREQSTLSPSILTSSNNRLRGKLPKAPNPQYIKGIFPAIQAQGAGFNSPLSSIFTFGKSQGLNNGAGSGIASFRQITAQISGAILAGKIASKTINNSSQIAAGVSAYSAKPATQNTQTMRGEYRRPRNFFDKKIIESTPAGTQFGKPFIPSSIRTPYIPSRYLTLGMQAAKERQQKEIAALEASGSTIPAGERDVRNSIQSLFRRIATGIFSTGGNVSQTAKFDDLLKSAGISPSATSVGGGGRPPIPPTGTGSGSFDDRLQAAGSDPRKLLGLKDLANTSAASARQLQALSQIVSRVRDDMKMTDKSFNDFTKLLNNANDQITRRDPGADFLTRKFGQKNAQGLSEGLIGGAFPLLFGQGLGASVGGGLGGFLGGRAGGMLGFGLSLVGTAVGSQVDALMQATQDTGNMLRDLVGNFDQIKESGLLASRQQEKLIEKLIEGGNKTAAYSIIQDELNRKLGVDGAAKLREAADAGDRMKRAMADLGVQLQLFIAGPLTDFLNRISSGLERKNLENRFATAIRSATPEAKAAAKEQIAAASERTGSGRSILSGIGNFIRNTFVSATTGANTGLLDVSTPDLKEIVDILVKSRPTQPVPQEQERQQAINAAEDRLKKAQDRLDIFTKQNEGRDIIKGFKQQVTAAKREQQDADRQSFELRRDYERQIGDIRRGIEEKIVQIRQENAQKELEILASRGQLAEQQFKNAGAAMQQELAGNELGQSLADAVTTYLGAQLSAQNEIEQRRKQFEVEIQNQQIELEKYKIDVARTISQLNISTVERVQEINRGIARRNEDAAMNTFALEKESARLRLVTNKSDLENVRATYKSELAGLRSQLATDPFNPLLLQAAKNRQAQADSISTSISKQQAEIDKIKDLQAPPRIREIPAVSVKNPSLAGVNRVSAEATRLSTALVDIKNQLTQSALTGSAIQFADTVGQLASGPLNELITQLKDARKSLAATGNDFSLVTKEIQDYYIGAIITLSRNPEVKLTQEILDLAAASSIARLKIEEIRPTIEFYANSFNDISSATKEAEQSISELLRPVSYYDAALQQLQKRGGIGINDEDNKRLLDAAKNLDNLNTKLKVLNALNDVAAGFTDSLIGFSKELITGTFRANQYGDALNQVLGGANVSDKTRRELEKTAKALDRFNFASSVEQFAKGVADKTLDVVLEFTLRPIQEKMFKDMAKLFGIEGPQDPLLKPVNNIDKNLAELSEFIKQYQRPFASGAGLTQVAQNSQPTAAVTQPVAMQGAAANNIVPVTQLAAGLPAAGTFPEYIDKTVLRGWLQSQGFGRTTGDFTDAGHQTPNHILNAMDMGILGGSDAEALRKTSEMERKLRATGAFGDQLFGPINDPYGHGMGRGGQNIHLHIPTPGGKVKMTPGLASLMGMTPVATTQISQVAQQPIAVTSPTQELQNAMAGKVLAEFGNALARTSERLNGLSEAATTAAGTATTSAQSVANTGDKLSEAAAKFQTTVGMGLQLMSGIAMGVGGAQMIRRGGAYNTLMGAASIFGSISSVTGMFGGGGMLSGLFGGRTKSFRGVSGVTGADGLGKVGPNFGIKQFAKGGRPDPYEPALIGENGIEVWMPDRPGTIISNDNIDNIYVPGLDDKGGSAPSIGRYARRGTAGSAPDSMVSSDTEYTGNLGRAVPYQRTDTSREIDRLERVTSSPKELPPIKYETTRVNDYEFVTPDQLEASNARTAKMARNQTLREIADSVKLRKKLGI